MKISLIAQVACLGLLCTACSNEPKKAMKRFEPGDGQSAVAKKAATAPQNAPAKDPKKVLAGPAASKGLPTPMAPAMSRKEKADAAIKAFCGRCHAFPDPGQFTMQTWFTALKFKYDYFRKHRIDMTGAPPPQEALAYFSTYAARTLLIPSFEKPDAFAVVATGQKIGALDRATVVADLAAVDGKDGFGGEILMSDLLGGHIYAISGDGAQIKSLATLNHPARITVTDLNRDGRKDIIAADLGTFGADDHKRGKVVWLRQKGPGVFEKVTILEEVGRVSEIAAGDVNGDGYPDLAVAEFGWLATGSLTLLINPGKEVDKKTAKWTAKKLDAGRGAVSVQIADLDGDEKADIVALFGQEREEVLVFKNTGNDAYRRRRIYEAKNPLWGSTVLRVVDLDKDGDKDVLVGNGDTLDSPRVAGFQGLHLLDNGGGLKFKHSQLVAMPGIQDVAIADVDGDADLDIIVASSVTPTVLDMMVKAKPAGRSLGSLLFLERQKDGAYKVKNLTEKPPCYSALAHKKGGAFYVGNFGIGWEMLGQEQTVAATQTQLSDCSAEPPLELWTLKARTEKTTPSVTIPKGRQAYLDEEQKRLSARVTAFRRLLVTQPLKASNHMGLGVALAQTGKKKEALEVMRKSVRINPTSAGLHVNVATLLNNMDEYKEAIVMANKALKLKKRMPEAYNAISIALARIGRIPEAVDHAHKAIRGRPKFVPFRFNLANLYLLQRKGEDALRVLDEILMISPGHPAAESMRMQIVQQFNGGRGNRPGGMRMPPPRR